MITDLRKKAEDYKNAFISNRSMLERDLDEFREKLKLVDPELLTGFNLKIEQIDAKILMPSLYAPNPSQEQVDKEAKRLRAIIKFFDDLQDKLIKEAQEKYGI